MNSKTIFKLGALLVVLTIVVSVTAFAQPFSTVYVDVSNGSDGYTGEFPTNDPAGRGPKATIGGGLGSLANNGTLVIFAGDYNGVDNAGAAVDIATGTYVALTTGLTIELRPLNVNTNVNLTAGAFTVNLTGANAVLTITNTGGARLNQTNTTVTLTAGNIDLNAAATWVLATGTTINLAGAASFTNAAPTRTTNVSLSYTGTGSFTAGPESNYGSYGTGTIAVGKTAGTTITFPNAITSVAAINVTGGNATFSAAVTVPAGTGDITNTSTGTVTFSSTLGLTVSNGVADANITSLENTSSGSIIVSGTTTWTGGANTADRDLGANYGLLNSGVGSLSVGAVNLVANDAAATRKYIFEARNSSTGTLTIGAVTATVTTTNTNYGAIRLTGTATAGTINIAGGTYRGFISVGAGHTLNVTGATTLTLSFVGADGIFTNAGTTSLTGNLTLSSGASIAHLTNGGTVSGASKIIAAPGAGVTHTFNGGTFSNVEVNANAVSGVVNFITNAFTITTLDLTAGSAVGLNIAGTTTNMNVTGATVTVATTIVQTVTNYSQTGGTFILAAGATTTLDVKGSFNRTTGTFANGGAGNTLVSFTGSGAQSVNGGSLFMVENITFTNAGGVITVGNSIRAANTVTLSTATNVDFGTTNLILNGVGNGMINNGTYTATGGGGVILGGTSTVVGGVAGNGFSLQGTGTYSFITVDVGSVLGADLGPTANSVASPTVITVPATAGLATGDVVFCSGSASIPAGFYALTLLSGTTFSIPVAAGADDGAAAYTIRQINAAKVTTTVTGVKWNGVLRLTSGALSMATAGLDFGPTGSVASIVRTPQGTSGIQAITGATFNTGNVSYDLTYTGALTANQSVGGELTATPANVRSWTISTTGLFNNDLPATASVNFGGTLTVSAGAFLRIPTGGAGETFTLSGASKTHTIAGTVATVDGNDSYIFSGANTTVNGSTVLADAATIGIVQFNATGLTVSNVQAFSGTVTTGAASTVTFGMGAAAADQVITGAITLGGTSFTMTTNLTSTAGVTHNLGILDFGANNLTTNAAFAQAAGSYASSGGYLIFSTAGTLTLTSAMPYLRANDVLITLGAAATVSQNLDITGATPLGAITSGLAVFNLTIQNTMTTNAGPVAGIFRGAGALVLAGSTVTASGDPTISNLTVNTTGTATLASSVAATARTFTITGVLTHTAGELALGINHVSITGTAGNVYARAVGTITASTGELRFAGAAAQAVSEGTTFSVPNLTISNATAGTPDVTFAGTGTAGFTVTGILRLTAGDLSSTTAGRLHIGNLATIERFSTVSSLTEVPTFDGDVNLSYRGATTATAASEMPTAASNKLNNMLVNMAAGVNTIALGANASLKGTLTLTAGTFNAGAFTLTIASGSTIVMNGGVLGFAPTVTTYNLTYTTVTVTTTNSEFQVGAGITVDLLTINPGAANTITLNAAKTVNNLTITTGTLANGGFGLTVLGNFNGAGGAFTGAGALIFNGTTAQTITLPVAGYTLGGNLTINNAAGVTLAGGNLTMGAATVVTFANGLFTTGTNRLVLAQTAAAQGFTITAVAPNLSHVVGNVRHAITAGAGSPTVYPNGRYEFPVGSTTRYRPFAITFTSSYPANNPTNIDVTHVNASPAGTVGLPLDGGVNIRIGSYPDFYWLVSATTSMGAQASDFEVVGTDLNRPFTRVDDLRIIRRFDGAADINPWALQGAGANYSNILEVSAGDSVVTVRNTNSTGGIITQGARFSIGIPTRGPLFTATQATASVDENATLRLAYYADPQDVGESITYSLSTSPSITTNAPSIAKASTAAVDSGIVTWTPSYTQSGTYTLTVSASDGQYSTTTTTSVTVVNVNRAPVFTAVAAQTVQDGQQLSVTLAATDADNDALTFSFVSITPAASVNPAVTSAGALTWTPGFADAAKTFTIRVAVSDGVTPTPGTDSLNITASVNRSIRRGDANLNGAITASDAAVVLQYTVDLYAPASADSTKFAYAADASGNGTITAFDASKILLFVVDSVANPIPSAAPSTESAASLSKTAVGSVEWGALKGGEQPDVLLMPMVLTGSKDVYSIEISMRVPNGIELKGMSANLPNGWLMEKNMSNGELRVAMAGTTPMASGEFGVLSFKVTDKEARTNPTATVTLNENVSSTMIAQSVRAIPTEFVLHQNYPNPFNPSTRIKYQLPVNSKVALEIFNIMGQKVRTLVNTEQESGYYSIEWNGIDDVGQRLASGIYLYRIQAGSFVQISKMIMLK